MNERLPYLREKTQKLTTSPGCYIMKNEQQKIIYIGKAKNLKNRVTSYFRESAEHTPKVAKMVSQVYDYDFIVTDSEFEALVLECSLIKQNMPKYNIMLKDDKGYSYIKISDGDYPKITSELQKDSDGTYIGPYTSSFTVRQSVNEANRVFMLPTCNRKFPQDFNKERPCLNYHIKLCAGTCLGNISKEDYNQTVEQAIEYMKSGSAISVDRLTAEMENAAEQLDFEKAAKLRDRINAIKKSTDSQKVVDESIRDTDVIAVVENSETACASVLMYRGGHLFDKVDFMLGELDNLELMREEFVERYYSNKDDIPRNVYIDEEINNHELLERFLREKSGHAVTVSTPKRGASLKLTMLAKSNASEQLSLKVGRTAKEIVALEELGKILNLKKPPLYIECYDISNLASTAMVAGMVVFENGRPNKKAYKKFSIKTVAEQNDYACMLEVLERRFKRYYEKEDEGFSRLPDLIFLDGGKGHVNYVEPEIRKMGINVPIFGLVKDNKHRTRAVTSGDVEISVSKQRLAFMLITKIQDEVHRFAINYQAQKHKKNSYQLELTKLKGIGPKKAQKLIMHFKTKEMMKKADYKELAQVAGINEELARELYALIQLNM